MIGPGKRNKDADIEVFLLSNKQEDVLIGIAMIDQRYRDCMARFLAKKFPGLTPDQRANVWEKSLDELTRLIQKGRYQATGSLKGLLYCIVEFRGIDGRRHEECWERVKDLVALPAFERVPCDTRLDRAELGAAMLEFMEKELSKDQRVVMRPFVKLFYKACGTGKAAVSMTSLTDEVNRAIKPRILSVKQVRTRHKSAMNKLRIFLIVKGFQ